LDALMKLPRSRSTADSSCVCALDHRLRYLHAATLGSAPVGLFTVLKRQQSRWCDVAFVNVAFPEEVRAELRDQGVTIRADLVESRLAFRA
jgi:hypothetical protein